MGDKIRPVRSDHWQAGRYGFPFIGGVENMQILYGHADVPILDVFGLNGHDIHWREDLTRFREAGGQLLRYPIPWHRIEQTAGELDWRWTDEVLPFARELGLELIVDACHMKSFPLWLKGGFLNPEFPQLYLGFVRRVADRYSWLTHWTAFNEPISSAVLWGRDSRWCADGNCDGSFVRALAEICESCSLVSNWLREDSRVVLMQVEAMEYHQTWPEGHARWDRKSQELVEFHNHRANIATDLLLGRVDGGHPMTEFLLSHGMEMPELQWFQENPMAVDVMGWDYYAHISEHFWQTGVPGWQRPGPRPLGLFDLFKKYVQRYSGYDVFLGETNIPGYVTDRLTWLRYVTQVSVQVQEWLRSGGRREQFRGLCWFPSFDSHSWTEAEMSRVTRSDPNGIWWIDGQMNRHDSELSNYWSLLCRGECGYEDLPVYRFNPELERDLPGYRNLLPKGAIMPEKSREGRRNRPPDELIAA